MHWTELYRRGASLLGALAALAVVGCGAETGLVPAVGQVVYKGQPAAGARVHFHRQDAPASARGGPIPSAVVDDLGGFDLTSGDLGRGAPAGRYAVLVSWPEGDGTGPSRASLKPAERRGAAVDRLPTDRLKGRYSNPEKPLLTAVIAPGMGQIEPFELKD